MCEICNPEKMLLSKGISPTPLRLAVLELLVSEKRSFTPEEILNCVSAKMSINKVTVYRILERLLKAGLIRRLSIGRPFRYEIAGKGHKVHPHLICNSCGKIECLDLLEFTSIISSLCKLYGIESEGVEIYIKGICKKCQK
ncbi:MAG: transcriptional repressor [Deltaproteobacteria bacterium]|nr:transcriptional repressor [Deltaproteobacteria bacterium]